MYISSDTNIWIDFYKIGRLDHPFRLDFQYYISRDTFHDEFLKSEPLQRELLHYGLLLADITNEEFMEAEAYRLRYPGLSVYDTFAMAIARCRGWVLLTGDKPLRNAAVRENIECHGTIWIYDQLKAQGKMQEQEVKCRNRSMMQ